MMRRRATLLQAHQNQVAEFNAKRSKYENACLKPIDPERLQNGGSTLDYVKKKESRTGFNWFAKAKRKFGHI